jgi:hypothetical protein
MQDIGVLHFSVALRVLVSTLVLEKLLLSVTRYTENRGVNAEVLPLATTIH